MGSKQATFDCKQVAGNPLGGMPGKWAITQRPCLEIGQQVVSDVIQQDDRFLGQETMFSASGQVQTLFVIAKLLDFGRATLVVQGFGLPGSAI